MTKSIERIKTAFDMKIWELLEKGRHSFRMIQERPEDYDCYVFHKKRMDAIQSEIFDLLEVKAALTGESYGKLVQTTPTVYSAERVTSWE